MAPSQLAHLGLDECGSLPDAVEWFVIAGVLTYRPDAVRNLIRRVAARSGKRLKRPRYAASEFKWNNSSRRFRSDVLGRLARADVEIFTLAVKKSGHRIEDTPEYYALLMGELLQYCWAAHPNMALALDRHFTSPAQVAVLNTFIYRHWPAPGVLSMTHVDSQRNTLVQLADFVAGSVYAAHKEGDPTSKLLDSKIRAEVMVEWKEIKRRWMERGK